MALQFSSSSKNSRQSNNPLFSDINVTPLVDVMLVLLIIFMITSPMMVAGINVDLPETKSSPIWPKLAIYFVTSANIENNLVSR